MPEWFIFIAVSVVALVVAEISQRVSMRKIEDISAEANNFIVWLVIGSIGAILSFLQGSFQFELLAPPHLLYFSVIGIIYFWGGKLFYSSYKGISAGEGSIIVTFSVVVSTILGTVLLHEKITWQVAVGVFLVLAAIVLLNYSKKFSFSKYTIQAFAGAGLFGLAYTIDKILVLQLNPVFYLTLFAFSIALISLVFAPKTIQTDLTKKAKVGNFKQMVISGVSFSVFNLFTFLAYSKGVNVGVADTINNTAVFSILLIEFLLFQERDHLGKKLFAAVLASLGVLLLVIY